MPESSKLVLRSVPTGVEGSSRLICLRSDVQVVHRARYTILFRAHGRQAVRVARTVDVLLSLLRVGARKSELEGALHLSHSNDPDVAQKLDCFLSRLDAIGLLETGGPARHVQARWHRWEFLDINPVAARLDRALNYVPKPVLNVIVGILATLAFVGIAIQVSDAPRPTFNSIFDVTSVWGIAFFLLVVVPVHELAHSVACRAAGVPVGGVGLVLHGGIIPGPFVDTSATYAVADRWLRFRVPIAGPLVDLYVAGAAAWLLLLGSAGALFDAPLVSIMILSTVFLLLDTNPFGPSDGSRALEAILDDELARRSAFGREGTTLSTKRSIWSYRFASALYICIVMLLVGVLWSGKA